MEALLEITDTGDKPIQKVLVLQQIDDKAPLTTTGTIDKRLFKGENNLRALIDEYGLWYFRYDSGGLQEPLKRKFTSFPKALDFATDYFNKRNVKIAEVR